MARMAKACDTRHASARIASWWQCVGAGECFEGVTGADEVTLVITGGDGLSPDSVGDS